MMNIKDNCWFDPITLPRIINYKHKCSALSSAVLGCFLTEITATKHSWLLPKWGGLMWERKEKSLGAQRLRKAYLSVFF